MVRIVSNLNCEHIPRSSCPGRKLVSFRLRKSGSSFEIILEVVLIFLCTFLRSFLVLRGFGRSVGGFKPYRD